MVPFARPQRRTGASLRTVEPAGGAASCGQAARLRLSSTTVCSTCSSGARRPAPAGGDRRPTWEAPRRCHGGRLLPLPARPAPTRRSQQTTSQRTRASLMMASDWESRTSSWYRSLTHGCQFGVAPRGPVGGGPIRAMTLISVLPGRLLRVARAWIPALIDRQGDGAQCVKGAFGRGRTSRRPGHPGGGQGDLNDELDPVDPSSATDPRALAMSVPMRAATMPIRMVSQMGIA
jgi:hypothetical protein